MSRVTGGVGWSRSRLAEWCLALSAVIVGLAGVPFVPFVNQQPGPSILIVVAIVAMVVPPLPAVLAVVVGAIGSEFLRSPVATDFRVQRSVAFTILGCAVVVIAFTMRTRRGAAEQHLLLFESHPLPMWLFDEETLALVQANDAAVQFYGYSRNELTRLTLRDLGLPEDRGDLEKRPWAGLPEYRETWRQRTKAGRVLHVMIRARAVQVNGRRARHVVMEDLTERRSLESQLRQAQKMDAIGQLAGGIAHDFNNLLTAIQGYATLLFDSLPAYDPRRDDAQEINRAAERAAELTRQLLAFSRKETAEPRVLEVSAAVQELAPMLRRLVDETIEVTTVAEAKCRVKADPVQIQQVLMNLVVNARDAIGQSGGRITVETADVVLNRASADGHPAAHAGPHVMIAVSDTGHGMDAETQTRIFEPFFTTKPQGQGTGLGLSTVYGIVQQDGGHVRVYSEVGRGTTFKVYLPVTDEAEAAASEGVMPERAPSAGIVLLLEDEDAVRRLVTKVLEKRGYLVHAAAHPNDALAIARRRGITIDLLLTDVVLPDVTGQAVAEAVRALHPRCHVLFMSGYTDDAIVRHGVLSADAMFLQKPFRTDGLVQKVAEALSEGRVSSDRV